MNTLTLQDKLLELRQQVVTLAHVSDASPEHLAEVVPAVVPQLQLLVDEAQALIEDRVPVPTLVTAMPALLPLPASQAEWIARESELRTHNTRLIRTHQERARSLMADLLLVEEHERRQLAMDLHDGLSQTLAFARIHLASLREASSQHCWVAIDQIESLLAQADASARAISYELSPPILHDLGLEPAVQWLAESMQTRYGLAVTFEDDGRSKPTDEHTRIILFRSIRELLINAAKHSHAQHVRVRMYLLRNCLIASVEDDGVGMDLDSGAPRGTGILSIRERLQHIGGTIHMESSPDHGMHIRMRVPITAPIH